MLLSGKRSTLWVAVLIVCLAGAVTAAPPELAESDISWQQVGTDVEFTLVFRNPDPVAPSDPVPGVLNSQEFGAFLDDFGLICNFDVPAIPPGGAHTVTCVVPLTSLPPSAALLLPGAKPSPGGPPRIEVPCTPPNWWGNVDVIFGTGLPPVLAHIAGNVPVCPGAGPTYIHVLVDNCPQGATWSFVNVCPNWTVSLVNDVGGMPGGPAPNPLPPNPPPFDGWICISANANVPIGSKCCFQLLVMCAGQTGTIQVCAEACDWSTVGIEQKTWGRVKALYHDQH